MAIEILQHQLDFIQSNHRHTGLVGGFRSGKSHAGVIKTVKKKLSLPGVDVAYYLPSYQLIKDIAFPKISALLTQLGITYQLNQSDKNFITPYGRIIMRSMDNHELIVGYEVGYSLIDEADILPLDKMEQVMLKIIARNSVKTIGNNNATDFVSTPEGYRFLYNFFVKNSNENKLLIRAKTENNPFISEDYIKALEAEYTPSQLQAYLNGEFVNLTSGNVYNEFSRERNHTDREPTDKDILHIGMDFNITKMNAVVHVIDGAIGKAVDEIVNKYDTRSMCQYIKETYPKNRIVVYPDASGGSRKTSSSETDLQIIKSFGFMIKADDKNPAVKDRTNTMNNCFHKNNYQVNVNRCPTYTQALEQLGYKNGEPDKQSGLDHITEAGGYFVHKIFSKKTKVYL